MGLYGRADEESVSSYGRNKSYLYTRRNLPFGPEDLKIISFHCSTSLIGGGDFSWYEKRRKYGEHGRSARFMHYTPLGDEV